MNSLKGKTAIVTGASRGIGKGIALGLAEQGATVYITGRGSRDENLPGFLHGTSIYRTAEEAAGLDGVVIVQECDHSRDEQVEALFKRVMEEQGGLDILVNNAWGGGIHAVEGYFFNTPFWEQPVALWDDNFNVGLRSNYVASRLAAKIMVEQQRGLIVNISFYGGRHYFNNVSYGVCKAAVDRLSADTAYELKAHGIPVVSLYPGQVSTEGMLEYAKYNKDIDIESMETPGFSGKCIAALATDPDIMEETGKILITAELAEKYGFTDINGRQPRSLRSELW